MNKLGILILSAILIPAVVSGKEPAKPMSIDDIQLLKISAPDQRAVIRTPDSDLQMIKAGDSIGDKFTVIEIADNRVVLEHTRTDGPETVIFRLVQGKQTVERISKMKPKQPLASMKQVGSGK